jgi:hypothetical protein
VLPISHNAIAGIVHPECPIATYKRNNSVKKKFFQSSFASANAKPLHKLDDNWQEDERQTDTFHNT